MSSISNQYAKEFLYEPIKSCLTARDIIVIMSRTAKHEQKPIT